MKVKNDHRSKFSNLSNWKEEAWKNQGFNGIRTRDLRVTSALLSYQLNYELYQLSYEQINEIIIKRAINKQFPLIYFNYFIKVHCWTLNLFVLNQKSQN